MSDFHQYTKVGPFRFYKAYWFLAPFLLTFLVFGLYPVVYTLYLSFTQYDGFSPPVFIGAKNYVRLVTDSYFLLSVFNTWVIWLVNFLPQIFLGLFLGAVFTYGRVKGMPFFRAIFYFPNLVAAASMAILFFALTDWEYGALNQVLLALGLIDEKVYWMSYPVAARGIVSFVQWWMWFGHSAILCMAGMTAIPMQVYEAARVDGAKPSQVFWHITLPMMRPTMLFILVTSLIGGMQIFEIPYLVHPGRGPDNSLLTMTVHMYAQAFEYQNYGYASAISWGIFLIMLVGTLFLFRSIRGNLVAQK